MSYQPSYKYIPPLQYRLLTPLYDRCCGLFGLGVGFKKQVLDLLPLRDGETLIDVGCATGVLLELVAERFPRARLIGIDPDADSLVIARQRLQQFGKRIQLIQGYAESLPIKDRATDVYISTLTFHHLPDKVKHRAAKEAFRVLKPGGTAIIGDFGRRRFSWLSLAFFFSRIEYEYSKSQFQHGLVPVFSHAGFIDPRIVSHHFPSVDILRLKKS